MTDQLDAARRLLWRSGAKRLLSVRGINAFPTTQKILQDILAASDDEEFKNNLSRLEAGIQASPQIVTFLLERGLLRTPEKYMAWGPDFHVSAWLAHLPWIKVSVRMSELPDITIDPVYEMEENEESPVAGRGKLCQQIIDEIRRIRFMCLDRGRTVEEVKSEHPEYSVWAIIDRLDAEDREAFYHPRRWGPVVGYATGILAKHYSRSAHTITSWRKSYKRHQRA